MARKAAASSTPTPKPKAGANPASANPRGRSAAGAAKLATAQAGRTAAAESTKPAAGKSSGRVPATSAKGRKAAPPPRAAETITLRQLADRLGEGHEMSPRQARDLLAGVIDLLVEHLKAGDKLRLKGLGVLEVKNRPARTARNPAGSSRKLPNQAHCTAANCTAPARNVR